MSGSTRGRGRTAVWTRYCGTAGQPGGNRENKRCPGIAGETGLLTEFSALCGTDNECAPGCFDNILRDNTQVVNAQDAFNLDKKPVQQPKVPSGDAGNRCNGLIIRSSGGRNLRFRH